MVVVHSEFRVVNLAYERLRKTVMDAVDTQMRQAARAFERAAIPRVPVDTGFAVSPFRNIGEVTQQKQIRRGAHVFKRKELREFGRKLDRLRKRELAIKEQLLKIKLAEEKSKTAKVQITLTEKYDRLLDKIQQLRHRIRIQINQFKRVHGSEKFVPTVKVRRRGGRKLNLRDFGLEGVPERLRELNVSNKRAKLLAKGNYYYPRGGTKVPKTPTEGRKWGTQPKDIITRNGNNVIFRFGNIIDYFRIEDLYGKHSGPWGAMKAGRKAFFDYWDKEGYRKLPHIASGLNQNEPTRGGDVANFFDAVLETVISVRKEVIEEQTRRIHRAAPARKKGDTRPVSQTFTNPEAEKQFEKASREHRTETTKERNKRLLKLRHMQRIQEKILKESRDRAEFEANTRKKIQKLQDQFDKLVQHLQKTEQQVQKKEVVAREETTSDTSRFERRTDRRRRTKPRRRGEELGD